MLQDDFIDWDHSQVIKAAANRRTGGGETAGAANDMVNIRDA